MLTRVARSPRDWITTTGLCVAVVLAWPSSGITQTSEPYSSGERKRLLITVNILGELRNPGEYTVADDTDLLGLIAKAGGTTEFGDLSAVRVTHSQRGFGAPVGARPTTETIDLDAWLKGRSATAPPTLQPGDVVLVSRNQWSKWRTVAVVLRDLSVVATAVFLGIRAFDDTRN